MRKITANSWQPVDKEMQIISGPDGNCNLHINAATPGEITLSGINMEGEVICLYSEPRQLHIKNNFEGFDHFLLKMTKPGGAQIIVNGKETGEPMNHEPPPAPIETNNIIARMRETARQQMGITREAFLENDTGLPGYENEPDYTFEEEEHAIQQQIDAQKAGKSEPRSDDDKSSGKPGQNAPPATPNPDPNPEPSS